MLLCLQKSYYVNRKTCYYVIVSSKKVIMSIEKHVIMLLCLKN